MRKKWKRYSKDNASAPEHEGLKQKILSKIDKDMEIITKFNQIILSTTIPAEVIEPNSGKDLQIPDILESLKTNKILPSLLYAKQFIEDNFDKLYDGEHIEGYNLKSQQL